MFFFLQGVMFFCIQDLAYVDPMYQYSLPFYIALFLGSVEKADKSADLLERIDNINNHFRYFAVYSLHSIPIYTENKLQKVLSKYDIILFYYTFINSFLYLMSLRPLKKWVNDQVRSLSKHLQNSKIDQVGTLSKHLSIFIRKTQAALFV